MSRSAIATQRPIESEIYIPIPLTRDALLRRLNGEKEEPIYFGPIKLTNHKKKKPKTERQMVEHIIDKKPGPDKVRKFFIKYADRITMEEEEQGEEFLHKLQG